MKYSVKDVVIGFIIIVLIIIGALYYKKNRIPKVIPTSSPVSIEFKKELEKNFKYDIPDDINSIELKDFYGGNGRGLATTKEILADVDDPQTGYFYEAWLQDSDSQELTSLGKLIEGKGGWMLGFSEIKYPEGKKIIISLESKFDNEIENKILEGSFN